MRVMSGSVNALPVLSVLVAGKASRESAMRRFGELEAVIMNRLWAWGRPALVREMVDDL